MTVPSEHLQGLDPGREVRLSWPLSAALPVEYDDPFEPDDSRSINEDMTDNGHRAKEHTT